MSRGWILMGAPEPFNNHGGGGGNCLRFLFLFLFFFNKNACFIAARSCLGTYGWCSHVFVVCFRRCGRVRKKHHCEADEDPTRQWLQRRVSAERTWAFSHYIYAYKFIFIYVYIFMTLPFMSNTVDTRMLYIPWMHSIQALQSLLGPLSLAKQLICFTTLSPLP